MAGFTKTFRKFSLAIVVVTMLITGALLVNLVYNPPTFNTDLDAFTPDSEASKAHDRIHQNFPNESRPMFVNVESDNGGNVLAIENIKLISNIIKHCLIFHPVTMTLWWFGPQLRVYYRLL